MESKNRLLCRHFEFIAKVPNLWNLDHYWIMDPLELVQRENTEDCIHNTEYTRYK